MKKQEPMKSKLNLLLKNPKEHEPGDRNNERQGGGWFG